MKYFEPNGFGHDAYTQDVRGLGKGKGFETSGRGSILGKNDVTEKIADRCLDLLSLFMDNDILSEEEVRKRLGLSEEISVVKREEDEAQALREERED